MSWNLSNDGLGVLGLARGPESESQFWDVELDQDSVGTCSCDIEVSLVLLGSVAIRAGVDAIKAECRAGTSLSKLLQAHCPDIADDVVERCSIWCDGVPQLSDRCRIRKTCQVVLMPKAAAYSFRCQSGQVAGSPVNRTFVWASH